MNRIDSMLALLLLATAGCADRLAEPATRTPADPSAPVDESVQQAPRVPVDRPMPIDDAVPVDGPLPPAMGRDLPAFTIGASSAEVSSTGPEAPILRAVRIGAHQGFDRIVFEFDSTGLPQWHVSYVDAPVIECGSGHEASVAGTAWLQVRFSGANAHTEAGAGTSGPARRTVALDSVQEVVRTCDFEAEVTWIAGVDGRQPYRPRVLQDPARLVVDIAH